MLVVIAESPNSISGPGMEQEERSGRCLLFPENRTAGIELLVVFYAVIRCHSKSPIQTAGMRMRDRRLELERRTRVTCNTSPCSHHAQDKLVQPLNDFIRLVIASSFSPDHFRTYPPLLPPSCFTSRTSCCRVSAVTADRVTRSVMHLSLSPVSSSSSSSAFTINKQSTVDSLIVNLNRSEGI